MSSDAPKPRLCRITKWPDFDGYGFHLQAIKSKPGQFIGKIDPGSPAEAAGLRQGDRIVEVNGVNINNENHVQVVERIKTNPQAVDLLVVDPHCYSYYSERNMVVQGTWDSVLVIANEPRRNSVEKSKSNGVASSDNVSDTGSSQGAASSTTASEKQDYSPEKHEDVMKEVQVRMKEVHVNEEKPRSGGLDFDGLSAAEMRARLAERKRPDPRQENISAQKKHQIIQAL